MILKLIKSAVCFILICFAVNFLAAQEVPIDKAQIVKEKISGMKIFRTYYDEAGKKTGSMQLAFSKEFDKNGNVMVEKSYYSDPKMNYNKTFKYNEANNPALCEKNDENGNLVGMTVYSYDKSNILTETSILNTNREQVGKIIPEFDAEKKILSESAFNETNQLVEKTVFQYNGRGFLRYRKLLNAEGVIQYSYEYTSDSEGKILQEKVLFEGTQPESTKDYKYDTQGLCIQIAERTAEGIPILLTSIVYEY